MKKVISMIAIIVSIGNISIAQENKTDFREELSFGIKGGVNYSNVYDSQGEEFQADPKLGLAGGAFVAIPIGRYFGIQPEALISQKGFRATGRILGGTYSFTRTTTYLDVPLLFSIKPSEFISLQVGPQYSYLIKQNDAFTNASTSIEQEQEFVNDNIRKNTLCFIGGADINLKHVVLGARAGWDILNNNGDGTSTTPRYKNVWYQATIGYRF